VKQPSDRWRALPCGPRPFPPVPHGHWPRIQLAAASRREKVEDDPGEKYEPQAEIQDVPPKRPVSPNPFQPKSPNSNAEPHDGAYAAYDVCRHRPSIPADEVLWAKQSSARWGALSCGPSRFTPVPQGYCGRAFSRRGIRRLPRRELRSPGPNSERGTTKEVCAPGPDPPELPK